MHLYYLKFLKLQPPYALRVSSKKNLEHSVNQEFVGYHCYQKNYLSFLLVRGIGPWNE